MTISKQQLIEVIAAGDDSIDNRLILEQDGRFRLLPLLGFDEEYPYVTRWETYDAGNDFIGVAASQDEYHIGKIWRWATIAWERYQSTGRIQIVNEMW